MILELKGIPNPKQAEFFRSTARHTAYGGARGGGKSWAVRTKAKLLAIIVIVFGTVLAMVNTSPAAIIVAAQAISGFILPFIAILLLVIANSKKLLGNYTNSVIRNVLGGIAAVATLGLAIRALYNLITTLAK